MNLNQSFLRILLVSVFLSPGVAAQQEKFKALLVTKTNESHYGAVKEGISAIRQLGSKSSFGVVVLNDPNNFTDKFLEQFRVVIFLCTKDNIFESAQKQAMERFIKSGKGYVGIHSASATEYDWGWYTKLVGRMFYIHPAIQTAKLKVFDKKFPGLKGFGGGQFWTDEWYEFGPERVSDLHYILGVDETTYDPKVDQGAAKGRGMGKMHPIAWYHDYDGGRSFYTALGHVPANFRDPAFLDHLNAGIRWAAAGKK